VALFRAENFPNGTPLFGSLGIKDQSIPPCFLFAFRQIQLEMVAKEK